MPSVNIDIEARELFDFSCEDDFNNRTIKGNIGELQVLFISRKPILPNGDGKIDLQGYQKDTYYIIQVKYHKRQNYEITDQVVEKKIQEFEEFLEEAKYYPNITLFF
ncbi:4058_t:CDS:2, partial [Gigaspora rosea]